MTTLNLKYQFGWFLIIVLVKGLFMAGCTESSETTPRNDSSDSFSCLSVSNETIEWIELELREGLSLSNVKAVKSNDFENVYFISGYLKGEEISGSSIVTFSNTSISSSGMVYSANNMASTFSGWQESDRVSISNHGFRESQKCVSG